MLKNTLKVGIIGTGSIARNHLQGYAACPDAEVVALCDVNPAVLQPVAEEFGIQKTFTDYQELLQLKEVQAVSICTPPFAHCEITLAAAEGGKHILCEKPMSLNAAEARQMVEAARKAGVKLGICHGRSRLSQGAQAAKKLIDSGLLGIIYYARISGFRRRGRPGLDMLVNSKWFLDSSKAGGGVLPDLICYDIDLLLYLLGSPAPLTVSATTFRGIGDPVEGDFIYDVEDHASLFVRFEGGVSVTFEKAWASNMDSGDGVRLFGSKGGLKLDPFTYYTEVEGIPFEATPQLPQSGGGNRLINDFVTACLSDTEPITPGEEGLKVMQIIDAAYQSARQGREVEVK